MLIKRDADVVTEDKNDRTAVYLAAEEDKLEALEVGVNITKSICKFDNNIRFNSILRVSN